MKHQTAGSKHMSPGVMGNILREEVIYQE